TITVVILGVLAAIAISQFGSLMLKSNEAQTKGNLGSLRAAISIYYGDNDSFYPSDDLTSLTSDAKYLDKMVAANLPPTTNNVGHGVSSAVTTVNLQTGNPGDNGGWAYDNTNPEVSSRWGNVVVSCSHQDLQGAVWSMD
ncbi:MAG TPA: hypothetical protein VMU17_06925, partial [Elusimicrobiota bacterium]|nr:hypothetical protein [Elusimicrobiota bacterium]